MAIDPPGFYGFRSQNSRQYPVWMNSGIPAPRTNRVQAKPEYENLPPAAEPPPKPPAPPPLMGDIGPAYAQAEGFGGNYGAPMGPNTSFGDFMRAIGDFMSAIGFSGFGSANNTTTGTAPLGAVTSEPLGAPMGGSDIGPGAGPGGFGGGLGSMGAAAMGLGVGGLGAMSGADIMGFGGAQEGGAGGGGAAGGDTGSGGGGAGSAGGGMGGIGGMDGAGNGMFRGGIVTANRLRGPDPRGPDDGYVAMDKGEGVLTAEAVRHYGPGLVHRLNRLAVPKKAMR